MKVQWLDTMNGNIQDENGDACALLTRRPQEYGPKHITVIAYNGDALAPRQTIGGADSDAEAVEMVRAYWAALGF